MSEIVQKIAIALRQASSVSSAAGTTSTVHVCDGLAWVTMGNYATAFRKICRHATLTALHHQALFWRACGPCILQLSLAVVQQSKHRYTWYT
jgi:hypothetical protein